MTEESFAPPNFLTESHAKSHAKPAPEHLANDVIKAGLAKKPSDVVIIDENIVYTRGYLPDNTPSNIFLYCGTVQNEPKT